MKKQPEVTKATKQAFIDAFCEICKTTPIEKITVQELSIKAGYNRCTFYEYFNNVYDLLEHIENELVSLVEANIYENIKNVEAAEEFISSLVNLLKGQEKYIDMLFSNSHNSGFIIRIKSVMLPAFMLRYNISDNDTKSKYVLEYHLSGVIALMTNWIVNKRDIPMQQIGDIVRGVLSEGVIKMLIKKSDKS